jgi:ribulose-5-phosphate 4-epimerase/fuculose-1-phosphate aldolase
VLVPTAGHSRVCETIAVSCRLLAFLGLAREKTGHVSARATDSTMLLRCRGPGEAGLAFTTPELAREMTFTGSLIDDPDRYEPPSEWPIHAAIYQARPDVQAVVHAHPYASTIITLCGQQLKPVIGAYDSSAMQLAIDGVPLYPRSRLICDSQSASDMVASLGSHATCLLKGHGIVTVGRSVEQATLRAIRLETLAKIHLDVMQAGGVPQSIDEEDLAFWKEFKSSRASRDTRHRDDVEQWTWRHYQQMLEEHEQGRHRPAGGAGKNGGHE